MPVPALETIDITSLRAKDSSDPIWEELVKTYITESYTKDKCKEIAVKFFTKFYPELDDLKSEGLEVLQAASSGFDVWLKQYLESIDDPTLKDKLVNAKNDGLTPLHYTIRLSCSACFTLLLAHNADVNAVSGNSETPLHRAIIARNANFVKQLLQLPATDLTLETGQSNNAFTLAVLNNNKDVMAALIKYHPELVNEQNSIGSSPLQIAAKALRTDMARLLLDAGADPNKIDENADPKECKHSPLYFVVTIKHYDDPVPFLRLLIEKGVKVSNFDMQVFMAKVESSGSKGKSIWRSWQMNVLNRLQEALLKPPPEPPAPK